MIFNVEKINLNLIHSSHIKSVWFSSSSPNIPKMSLLSLPVNKDISESELSSITGSSSDWFATLDWLASSSSSLTTESCSSYCAAIEGGVTFDYFFIGSLPSKTTTIYELECVLLSFLEISWCSWSESDSSSPESSWPSNEIVFVDFTMIFIFGNWLMTCFLRCFLFEFYCNSWVF